MVELMFSALARNFGGRTFPNSQINAAKTIAKLIHLKRSVKTAALAPP